MDAMDWGIQTGSAPAIYQEFLVPAMFAPFAERLVEHGCVRPGSRVLDVACGTGVVSRAAAILAGTGGSVAGVDLGEPTVAIARTHRPRRTPHRSTTPRRTPRYCPSTPRISTLHCVSRACSSFLTARPRSLRCDAY